MKQFEVIGFGALNMDKLYRVNRIATAEEESFVIDFEETCGGSAANTIVGLARLGLKVGYIGKVAKDREGKLLLNDFEKEGVDVGGVIVAEKGRSGGVMGFVDTKGERALYVDPSVNNSIKPEEINFKYAANTKFLHLTSFVGEESFETQKKLVEQLPPEVKVSLDPGELYARKGPKLLKSIIEKTFVVIPNENEVELLTNKDYKEGSKTLLDEGASIVAVKLGNRGCYVTNGKESHLIGPFKAKAIDTTGAGDAFCAGFLYGLIKGKNLKECGKLGNFVASRCIMKMGARTGLPRFSDIRELEGF